LHEQIIDLRREAIGWLWARLATRVELLRHFCSGIPEPSYDLVSEIEWEAEQASTLKHGDGVVPPGQVVPASVAIKRASSLGFHVDLDSVRRAVQRKEIAGGRCRDGRVRLKVALGSFLEWVITSRKRTAGQGDESPDVDEPSESQKAGIDSRKRAADKEKRETRSLD
jgi:hypothetical protein